ncbi:Sterol 3-beta-glucosyltransferase UGT80A2 [Camellia lanceoleosa]|uniref:Sterol 3-beta-glucosyltransferase UGT80A2 n=1 Tax=Camellia lanceoleosa TaxID=1840588 RepID=A0ACC0H8I8_9ERIC|nr:Sterol 3-beta-glucosyltransferase UGT80A2 [Camellia lanceoleosa]
MAAFVPLFQVPSSIQTSRLKFKAILGTSRCSVIKCSSSSSSNGSEPSSSSSSSIDKGVKTVDRVLEEKRPAELSARIASGEFTVEQSGFPSLIKCGLSKLGISSGMLEFLFKWIDAPKDYPKIPEAKGAISAIRSEAFFVALYELFLTYGGIFRLTFGPKSFLIVSDPSIAKHILRDNLKAYSKGILAEILEFVMGKGLLPAAGEIWRVRQRAIVPALHQKYVAAMISLFGKATDRLGQNLDAAASNGEDVEMESLFARLTLDIIGKALFNYDFDSLTNDTGIVEAVYTVLREAEDLSVAPLPYWDIPIFKDISPQQKKVTAALKLINETLDDLIAMCKLKWVNRLATVKNDGTVQFEVPGDIKPKSLDFGAGVIYTGTTGDEPVDAVVIPDLPPLQIVMLIVGTRGDVQPFVAIGKRLQEFGHRVRLATHSNFKEFVLAAGLEFFPLGGDPKVLVGHMVKNKGFLPSGPSEIPIQRNQIKEIIFSLLPACTYPDPDTRVPFKVDAIIANPPAYGQTHVAEALKVPLHIFFTMPWTPTSEVSHPFSRVKQQVGYRLSYQIVDALIWLGIWDIINEFRKKKLKLRPVTYLSGSYSSPDVPYGYLWSPHLVPKPKDWGPKIDVVGFCFLDLASNYVPPDSLVQWLENGRAPIYIGFGSLPVQEPEEMTNIIVKALQLTGQRGIINKGWGGLGNLAEPKDFVYSLDNCPHDWLFLRCAAVVHHGGAGTTAAGLKAACPTTVVPFFGDQPFWGERVHARGIGPPPIPIEEFSLEKLVNAIHFMQDPMVKQRAVELAKAMENEDGATGAVNAFYKHFPRECLEPKPDPPSRPQSSAGFLEYMYSSVFCFL